jgi:hypothetical protein
MAITPAYEDEIPVANKVTIAPHTDHERTILLKVPAGRENRKKTAQLLPFIVDIERLRPQKDEDGEGESQVNLAAMAAMIDSLWGENSDKFEDEILPFALQMDLQKDQKYLDKLTLMEAFEAFLTASMFHISGGRTDEAVEALKKSKGGGGAKEE